MAGIQTLIEHGATWEPTTHEEILGPRPTADVHRAPGRKAGTTRIRVS
jgi:hypothetical protein